NAVAGEDRVGQAAAGQFGFPADALLFVPGDGQAGLGGDADAAGAAELGRRPSWVNGQPRRSPDVPGARAAAAARVAAADNGYRHGAGDRVTDTQLERPVLRPFFFLLVLADLDENLVAALLEQAAADVLIHLHAVMVFLAEVDLVAVEVDADGVVAAGAQLDGPFRRGLDGREAVGDRAMQRRDDLVEVDEAQL